MLRVLIPLFALGGAVLAVGAGEPVNPFAAPDQAAPQPNGYLVLSDGTKIEGLIGVTPGLLLRIYDRARKVHVDLAFEEIRQIDVEVEQSWFDQEWRFKEPGSPEKVYADTFYWNHKYACTVTLDDGSKIHGNLNAVLYLENAAGRKKLFIHKFLKGEQGPKDKVPEIIYVRQVVIGAAAEGERK